MNNYLKTLNIEQQQAVEAEEKTILIIAGPGTGKTKTLIARITNLLIQNKCKAEEILPITFTNKAAKEIKDRLTQFQLHNIPHVYTFHSFASSVLQQNNLLKTKKLISENQREQLLEDIIKNADAKLKSRDLSLLITKTKAAINTEPEDDLVKEYNNYLLKNNFYDFDDLLLSLYKFLQENSFRQYKHILVDEFQDTNIIQYKIIKLLATEDTSLFVIGDPLQSIYRFRGATGNMFDTIKKDFPLYREIIFTQNYRSAKNIVLLSNQLFPKKVRLKAQSEMHGTLELVETLHEYSEGEWITKKISELVGGIDLLQSAQFHESRSTHFREFAVVYRTHAASIFLEEKFNTAGIPYQIIGKDSPYQQEPLAFLLVLLQYVTERDENSLKKISFKTLKKLEISLPQLKLYLDSLQQEEGAINIINKIIETISLKKIATSRISSLHIQQLLVILSQFSQDREGLKKSSKYFQYLSDNEYYDPTADRVSLLTMHSAKGLEFENVFIAGFEHGSIPFIKDKSPEELEEEKRLFYVALTRAKNRLYITHTQERYKEKTILSEFYNLIKNPCLIEVRDEAIERLQRKRKEYKEKKAQLGLF